MVEFVEAIIRDAHSGRQIARVRLNGHRFESAEGGMMRSFEILSGDLGLAWRTGARLLMCPGNGPAMKVTIAAYPTSAAKSGLVHFDR